jgi:hypothetical protein
MIFKKMFEFFNFVYPIPKGFNFLFKNIHQDNYKKNHIMMWK